MEVNDEIGAPMFSRVLGHFSDESLKEYDYDDLEMFAISTRFATGGIGRDHTELRAYLTSLLEDGYSDDELKEIWNKSHTYYFTTGAWVRKMLPIMLENIGKPIPKKYLVD